MRALCVTIVVAIAAPALAQAPAVMTREQALAAVSAAIATKPVRATCGRQIGPLSRALNTLTPNDGSVTPETKAGFVWLGSCAVEVKNWDLALFLGKVRNYPFPALASRAALAMGKYELAIKLSQDILVAKPNYGYGHLNMASANCYLERWAPCDAAADAALKSFTPNEIKNAGPVALRRKVEALFHLGKLVEAGKTLDAYDKARPNSPDIDVLRRRNAIVQNSELIVDRDVEKSVSLGLYHLYVQEPHSLLRPLVHLKLYNLQKTDRQLRVETAIDGITEKVSKTVMVLRGKRSDLRLTPVLKHDFKVTEIRADRPVQLSLKITALDKAGEKVVYEKSVPIKLLPRDTLLFARNIGETSVPVFEFVGAWVTPNARPVEEFLTAAKKRLPPGVSFSGEQAATLPQVKALWAEMQSRGVSYVMDPSLSLESARAQRTRLPSEVLKSTNAQCVEGSVLFASLMEAVGLRPFLVIVPGHMFVGWHATAKDGRKAGAPLFLETTMVKSAPFEDAMKVAAREANEAVASGHFKQGRARSLEVAELRKLGIKPQPID